MLTPEQIQRRALNRYPEYLRSICTGAQFFPLTVFGAGLAKPNDFSADRAAIEALRDRSKEHAGFGYEISWEERNFRRLGTQRIPNTVFFPSRTDYLRFIDKEAEALQFQSDYALILKQCPELGAWAQAKPLRVVANAGKWQGLLDVCVYLQGHPRPNCYLRELPVVVDTKFVESHKGILTDLLPIVAPRAVEADNNTFEARFGFRIKQPLVRMRFLDEEFANRLTFPISDFATPLDIIRNFAFNSCTVLIVENEMTFLTLPALAGTIALYGAGDAAALLTSVTWLKACRLFYWGDLDAHGFETLAHLRNQFPHIVSVLMDENTLASHSSFAVKASATRSKKKLELNSPEQYLYDQLVERGILLEQERIPDAFSRPRLVQVIES